VPSLMDHNPQKPSFDWVAVMRTLLFQVLVLGALAVAFAGYVEWSSNTTWAEFIAVNDSSAQASSPHPQASTAIHTVKNQVPCTKPKG
jgi:hypothetical protein